MHELKDWDKIRREYETTRISQRKLAEKHHVSKGTLMTRAAAERWNDSRKAFQSKARERAEQKALDAISDGQAELSAACVRVRLKLMQRIEAAIDKMPEVSGSRTYQQQTVSDREKGTEKLQSVEYDIRNLTAAYRDIQKIVDDNKANIGSADDPLNEILKRWDNAAGIASEPEAD